MTFSIEIKSYKHDGTFHRSWDKNIVLNHTDEKIIGVNEEVLVTEREGNKWRTKEPAIFYFPTGQWFNIIILLKPDRLYYYCNISSPFFLRSNVLTYVDYDIDIIVNSELSYEIADEDEYLHNQQVMHYPNLVKENVSHAIDTLKQWIHEEKEPFKQTFIDYWYKEYTRK